METFLSIFAQPDETLRGKRRSSYGIKKDKKVAIYGKMASMALEMKAFCPRGIVQCACCRGIMSCGYLCPIMECFKMASKFVLLHTCKVN